MNKNTLFGMILIGVILFGFSWYNTKQEEASIEAQKQEQIKQDSIQREWERANPQIVEQTQKINQKIETEQQPILKIDTTGINKYREGVETFHTLENDVFKVTFSNLGGRIASVELKDYKRLYEAHKEEPLKLFFPDGSKFGLEFYTPELVNTSDFYFETKIIDDNKINYRLYADKESYIEYQYSILDDYMMNFKIDVTNFKNNIVTNQPDLKLEWSIISPQEEKGYKNENNYTTVIYKFPHSEDIEELGASTDSEEEDITTQVEWIAFKQQFFSSIIISKDNFSNARVGYNTYQPNSNYIKSFNAEMSLPYSINTQGYDFDFYFGPNKYSILNSYDELELQKIVPLGWGIIGWVNRFIVIPTFDFLGKYLHNYGLIIFLLTIIIKVIISPLTYKSYLSTAKMRLLKPDVEKISAKYPKRDDAMKKQQAMMALYKSAGASPMGGCIPMLIQFPILIAMFKFFPSSIELRGQSFLWSTDLSSYDSIWNFSDGFTIPFYGDHISLFTILMAISLFFTSKINMSQQPSNNQMPGMQFMMLYMMPLMMVLWFNDYSSGLSYYYLISNVITIGQTYAFRYFVDDNKLHAKMKVSATKPVKKSKWAERLEQMQKQAAEKQKKR